MGDAWLNEVAIRVTNLERALAFDMTILDLEVLECGSDGIDACVSYRNRRAAQWLDMNHYRGGSPYWSDDLAGDGPDHLEIRVRDVRGTLVHLCEQGNRSRPARTLGPPKGDGRSRR